MFESSSAELPGCATNAATDSVANAPFNDDTSIRPANKAVTHASSSAQPARRAHDDASRQHDAAVQLREVYRQ